MDYTNQDPFHTVEQDTTVTQADVDYYASLPKPTLQEPTLLSAYHPVEPSAVTKERLKFFSQIELFLRQGKYSGWTPVKVSVLMTWISENLNWDEIADENGAQLPMTDEGKALCLLTAHTLNLTNIFVYVAFKALQIPQIRGSWAKTLQILPPAQSLRDISPIFSESQDYTTLLHSNTELLDWTKKVASVLQKVHVACLETPTLEGIVTPHTLRMVLTPLRNMELYDHTVLILTGKIDMTSISNRVRDNNCSLKTLFPALTPQEVGAYCSCVWSNPTLKVALSRKLLFDTNVTSVGSGELQEELSTPSSDKPGTSIHHIGSAVQRTLPDDIEDVTYTSLTNQAEEIYAEQAGMEKMFCQELLQHLCKHAKKFGRQDLLEKFEYIQDFDLGRVETLAVKLLESYDEPERAAPHPNASTSSTQQKTESLPRPQTIVQTPLIQYLSFTDYYFRVVRARAALLSGQRPLDDVENEFKNLRVQASPSVISKVGSDLEAERASLKIQRPSDFLYYVSGSILKICGGRPVLSQFAQSDGFTKFCLSIDDETYDRTLNAWKGLFVVFTFIVMTTNDSEDALDGLRLFFSITSKRGEQCLRDYYGVIYN